MRGMEYTIPNSDGFDYHIHCSYCSYTSFEDSGVKKIEDVEFDTLIHDHICHERCNAFTCKKPLFINNQMRSEFYVVDEKYFMCFKCVKEGKMTATTTIETIRAFWKIPKCAVHVTESKKRDVYRNTEYFRLQCPWIHEDLWYRKYYHTHKNDEGVFSDYVIYSNLARKGIVALK